MLQDKPTETPVFIVGCDRSGTTLLRLMLNTGPDLYIPAESRFFGRLQTFQHDYGDFTQTTQRYFFIRDLQRNQATKKTDSFSIFNLPPGEAEAAIQAYAPTNLAGATTALYRAAAHAQGKLRWGDKTPRYIEEIDLLAEAFPKAQFVHVIRDGRDVAISIRRAGWVGNIPQIAEYWKQLVLTGQKSGCQLGPGRYREIRYEQLVTHPEAILKDLCSWLNLQYTPSMLEYHRQSEASIPQVHADLFKLTKQPVNASRVGKWRVELKESEIFDFENIAGDLLNDLGYELSGKQFSLKTRLHRHFKDTAQAVYAFLKSKYKKVILDELLS